MSAKKKKQILQCGDCSCYVLTKDIDRHKDNCGGDIAEGVVPAIDPGKALLAFTQGLERVREALSELPAELCGWSKQAVALVNPDTLSLLQVLPRQPCLLCRKNEHSGSVVILWPSAAVTQLRIHCAGVVENDEFVRVVPLHDSSLKIVSSVSLRCLPPFRPFHSTHYFREYINVYFSSSFLALRSTVSLSFYGHRCEFMVEDGDEPLEERLQGVHLHEHEKGHMPTVLKLSPSCHITVVVPPESEQSSSRLTLADFGGAEKCKSDLKKFLIDPIKSGSKACSVLVSGASGCGKSLLLEILRDELASSAITVRHEEDFDEQLSGLQDGRPIAVILDHFDEILKATDRAIVQKLSRLIDENQNVSVVVAVRNVEDMELSLRRRFALEVELAVPSPHERVQILKILLRKCAAADETTILNLAGETHGFTGSDLRCVCDLSNATESTALTSAELWSRFEGALRRVRPTGIRQFVLEVPDVRWDDIGGNEALKLEIQQAVIWPHRHAAAFERFGVSAPSGILLYGPPGCCKTLVARALASQSKMNFLSVKGPELFSKWVGESERAVRELFRRARQVAPAILFFDEIDAVAVSRGDKSGSGVGDRVLAQLLTELDGLEKKSGVLVLAATNRPDTLDGAILRPGRLDRAIYVPLPDEHTRRSIFVLQLAKMKTDETVAIDSLVSLTEGYSGAEVVALCRNAALIAMREDINIPHLSIRHFNESLKMIVPRTNRQMLESYEKFSEGARAS